MTSLFLASGSDHPYGSILILCMHLIPLHGIDFKSIPPSSFVVSPHLSLVELDTGFSCFKSKRKYLKTFKGVHCIQPQYNTIQFCADEPMATYYEKLVIYKQQQRREKVRIRKQSIREPTVSGSCIQPYYHYGCVPVRTSLLPIRIQILNFGNQ